MVGTTGRRGSCSSSRPTRTLKAHTHRMVIKRSQRKKGGRRQAHLPVLDFMPPTSRSAIVQFCILGSRTLALTNALSLKPDNVQWAVAGRSRCRFVLVP